MISVPDLSYGATTVKTFRTEMTPCHSVQYFLKCLDNIRGWDYMHTMPRPTERRNMTSHAAELTDLRADFVERLGVLAQAEGGSRNAGRLFGLLAFEGRAMTAAEIAEALRIGRSSVVEGAKYLETHGMSRRLGRKGQRQDEFELTPSVLPALQNWIRARRAAVCREFDEIISALPDEAGDTRERLESFARFHRRIEAAIASAQDETSRQ